jgi:septal ring factor EnvC (AmiA/AmiB activator)
VAGLQLNEQDADELVAQIQRESTLIKQDSDAVESLDAARALVQETGATVRNDILPTMKALDEKRIRNERLRRELAALQGK